MQSDNCMINMYISMWKLWIKNIYMPKKKINYFKKKYTEILAWAMNVFIYLFHVFVVSWLCAVGLINVQTEQTDWYV